MPIPVECPKCGHSIRAKDEFEGRKVRCPKCPNVLTIERLAEVVEDEPDEIELEPLPAQPMKAVARPKPKPRDEDPDLFAEDEPAPRKPNRSGPVVTGGQRSYSVTPPGRGRPAEDDDEEEVEERPRPRRTVKRKKRRQSSGSDASVGLMIVGGLMMIGGIVWFVVGYFNGLIFYKGPPILVVFGLVNIIKGMIGQNRD